MFVLNLFLQWIKWQNPEIYKMFEWDVKEIFDIYGSLSINVTEK